MSVTAINGSNVNVYVSLGGTSLANSSTFDYFSNTWFSAAEVVVSSTDPAVASKWVSLCPPHTHTPPHVQPVTV